MLGKVAEQEARSVVRLKNKRYLDLVYKISCWGLGSIFIYAGAVKLMAPNIFATLIDAYGIMPEPLVMPLAVVLPAFEVLLGAGVLLNIKGSLSGVSALLLLFITVLIYGIWMGLDVDCGCFGSQDPEAKAFHGLWLTLYRDLAMLVGIVFLFGWRRYRTIQPISLPLFIKDQFYKRRR